MAILRTIQFCAIICVFLSVIHFNAAERYDDDRNLINVAPFYENFLRGFLPEKEPPRAVVFFFGTLAVAVFIKSIFEWLKIKSPPSIMIFPIGTFIGWMAVYFPPVHLYVTDICDMSPKYLYMIFLPVLVFHPSYNIDTRLFKKRVKEILVLSTIGFLISSLLMTWMVTRILYRSWSFQEAFILGIIFSTCYSEYTVIIFQDFGQPKPLSIIIEGFVIGKITVCILTNTSHDTIGRATITLVMTYFSFYMAEVLIGCSGVLSVLILGMVISNNRLNFHTQSDTFLQQFWDLLYFYVNSLIFMVLGVWIFEKLIKNFSQEDALLPTVLYVTCFVSHVVKYTVINVILKWCKYEVSWRHVLVTVWGNFRGPISLCLAFLVSNSEGLEKIGTRIAIFTALVVILTYVVQGTTLYFVTKLLGIREISESRLANMSEAMKYLQITRERSINMVKMDRHLADANWMIVEEGTQIKHPYEKDTAHLDEGLDLFLGIRMASCPDCEKEIQANPTYKDDRKLQKHAYQRILKARKMSYRNQYEHGVLSQEAANLLVTAIDTAIQRSMPIMNLKDLRTHLTRKKITGRIRKCLIKLLWRDYSVSPPHNRFRLRCHRIISSRLFEYVMCVISVLQAIPVSFELYLDLHAQTYPFLYFMIVNHLFLSIFIVEACIKWFAFGCKKYFKNPFNIFDFILLLVSLIHICYYYYELIPLFKHNLCHENIWRKIAASTLSLRLLKIIRLLKICLPKSLGLIDTIMENHVALNFDVGRGFIVGEEEIIKILPHIIGNKKFLIEIKQKLEADRLTVSKMLGYIEKEFPQLAISFKTRQAIRIVLNKIGEAVNELKNRGFLDDFEYLNCKRMVEKHVKYLQRHYKKVDVSPPHILLNEVFWIARQTEVTSFLLERTQPVNFNFHEIIISHGSIPEALYIILYGIVKLVYVPTQETLSNLKQYGALPNVDYFTTLNFEEKQEEYIVGGNVIGELGILTGRPYDITAKCETSVQAFKINAIDLLEAMNVHSVPNVGLRAKMWKTVAIRVANVILTNTPHYQAWTQEEIMYHLERAYVPNLAQDVIFTVSDYIEDVLLIEGQVMDFYSRNIYFAPCCLPRTTQKLYLPRCEGVNITTDISTKLLIIPMKHVYEMGMKEDGTNMNFTQSFSVRCLHHSVLHSSSENVMRDLSRSLLREVRRNRSRRHYMGSPLISTPPQSEMGRYSYELNLSENSMFSIEREIESQLLSNGGTQKPIVFIAKEEGKTRISLKHKNDNEIRSSLSPKIITPNQSSESSNEESNKADAATDHRKF